MWRSGYLEGENREKGIPDLMPWGARTMKRKAIRCRKALSSACRRTHRTGQVEDEPRSSDPGGSHRVTRRVQTLPMGTEAALRFSTQAVDGSDGSRLRSGGDENTCICYEFIYRYSGSMESDWINGGGIKWPAGWLAAASPHNTIS